MTIRCRTLTALVAVAGLLVPAAGAHAAAKPLPAHVYAPYFETWTTDSISTIAQQSGARYFTLAFLETLNKHSCTLAWNGSSSQTVASGRYLSDIASLRTMGGDVVLSLGGCSADQGGTEIGDSCGDPQSIAAAYESAITTYNVSRLDMDVEGRSLTKTDGIDRRNKAIKLVEDWATANVRPLQISYTLPTTPSGLETSGMAVLRNAIADNARVDVVNIMTFDYYDHVTTDMGAAADQRRAGPVRAAAHAVSGEDHRPALGDGGDDHPAGHRRLPAARPRSPTWPTPSAAHASPRRRHHTISTWAIQRDNGGCPGQTDGNDCSGIVQNPWDFSHLLEQFTGP